MKKVTIVVPAFNEESNLAELSKRVDEVIDKTKFSYKILFVDDGSTDRTLDEAKRLNANNGRIHYISFSRNFGHQAALRAGLQFANADAVITMDCDLQHPPKLIPDMLKEWEMGADIVYTRRIDKEGVGFLKRITSRTYYNLLNSLSGLKLEHGSADFRLIDSYALGVINGIPEPNLFLRGLINWAGFKASAIDYIPSKRFAGKSKFSYKKMLSLAFTGITQFSIKPLRLSLLLGSFVATVGFLYGIYILWSYFVAKDTVSGWTSVMVVLLLTSGVQMMLLGVIGEYLGRTFIQTKHRPDYIIRESSFEK